MSKIAVDADNIKYTDTNLLIWAVHSKINAKNKAFNRHSAQ